MNDLFAQIRRSGVAIVAKRLGLAVLDFPSPGSLSPCPGCGADKRGSGDRRGPIGLHRDGLGWLCHRCKLSGDALSLAALSITGLVKPNASGWKLVREKFLGEDLPTYQAPPRAHRRPPTEEVLDVWSRATSVARSAELVPVLEERGFDAEETAQRDLCRALPPGHLPSWAQCSLTPWGESGHLCLFPLYDHRGQLTSLHARRMEEGAPRPKGLSPLGYESAGLCFLDALARGLFEGVAKPRRLIVAEGAPDFLSATLSFGEANEDSAVASVLSGSWTPEFAKAIPVSTHIILATHEDQAGERFAKQIAKTFTRENRVSRWRFPQ